MNFSAFGGFSGIHQFAAKFGHDAQSGAFTSAAATNMTQDIHGNRYHTSAANTNHFNQNTTSSKSRPNMRKTRRFPHAGH